MPQLIYQLPTIPSFFESILALPNGTLLLSRQDVPELWEVNPTTKTGRRILHIPGVESLTGLTELSPNIYVVGGGTYRLMNHEGSVPGSYSLWLIDLSNPDSSEEKFRKVASVPHIGQVNGLERWDDRTVLVADSYFGKIYRVDVVDGTSEVCFEDGATTTDAPGAPVRMSVNGIKVRWDGGEGGKYIYFTNTTRLLFCRVPVGRGSEEGKLEVGGPVEILASGYDGTTAWFMPDDFCFAEDGTAFITSHPTNMVFKTVKGGGVVRIAGGLKEWDVAAATACVFGKGEADRGTLYVCTAGANVVPIEGKTEGAKVVAVEV
ncbi:hypothetical protein DM02DRAFT_704385 [Periconia macrospinosa]|uniref:SMP-30/Gluconolactonase/LRE-like region domain-containing protein n=1 Tax=Periconia macrospinosa TaxID=97972 RepID=A0A2V1DWX2_9PLEO|nr:hypothetical protein DM02DRAFT_704385 [Periconia macrospinosa]